MFGSNAEQVLTHGKYPVILGKKPTSTPPSRFRSQKHSGLIDNTPESAPVLTASVDLANISGAGLHLYYVVPTLGSVSPEEAPGGRLGSSHTTAFCSNWKRGNLRADAGRGTGTRGAKSRGGGA